MTTFEITFRIERENPGDADNQIKIIIDADSKYDTLALAADQLHSRYPHIRPPQVFPQLIERHFP